MRSLVTKRMKGLRYIPQIYRRIYRRGNGVFIASLLLFPFILVVALTFGRSTQREVEPKFH